MSNRQLPPPVPVNTAIINKSNDWFVALTSNYSGTTRTDGQHTYQGSAVTSWQSLLTALPGVQEIWMIMGPTSAAQAYQAVMDHAAGRRSNFSCIRMFG